MLLKSDGGKEFEQPPAGNHIARCYQVIDLGTQAGEYQGKPNEQRKVSIRWELCNELMTDGEMAGKPFSVGKIYTASLSEKATLRHHLESWRGKAFTDAELMGFDSAKLLGVPCMVNVGLTEKNKAKVLSVAAVPKGMTATPQVNPSTNFSLDKFDGHTFEGLSKWLKGEIIKSPEYKKLFETGGHEPDDRPPDNFDDSIPF
jgi:hypothetical protein